jgi:hypothetical protein
VVSILALRCLNENRVAISIQSLGSFMTPFGKVEEFELNLRLSPTEALNRIIEASDEQRRGLSFSGYKGTNSFLHKFDGNTLTIQKRRYYRNDFHPYLYAQFEPTSFGSKLTGRFAMNQFTRGFMLLWFGLVGFGGIVVAISIIGKVAAGQSPKSHLLWLLHPIGMLAFGCLLVVIGEWFSRKEKQEITDWLDRLFADSIYLTATRSLRGR